MGIRRGRDKVRGEQGAEVDELEVLRDAEESLVAALQESDTAVEALHDTAHDAPDDRSRQRWTVGLAGLVLAVLGFVVARRRR